MVGGIEVSEVMNPQKLKIILTKYGNYDVDLEKEDYIEFLEDFIARCNEAYRNGKELVPDAIYDACIDYLRELNPDSELLHQVWSADDPDVEYNEDLDKYLVQYPMLSIQTVKHPSDKACKDFLDRLPVGGVRICATIKENGHAVRVVWKDGYLVKATSRGRSTNGRDLTRHMKVILGEYNESLSDFGLVEMRGELLLPIENLSEARKFNPNIKSAFTGVASMARESASDEEISLLEVVFYDILGIGDFMSLSEKLEFIEGMGFNVPIYFTYILDRKSFYSDLERILEEMDQRTQDYRYYTDGVVISIDDLNLFEEFGSADSYRYGNLALKMGRWKQDGYVGIIKEIQWVDGKSKKTPVAILEEGVLTATGNTVTNIPLYAPAYILMLEAYPGNPIHFRYGGEAGVIPTTPDGRLVTDKELRN